MGPTIWTWQSRRMRNDTGISRTGSFLCLVKRVVKRLWPVFEHDLFRKPIHTFGDHARPPDAASPARAAATASSAAGIAAARRAAAGAAAAVAPAAGSAR